MILSDRTIREELAAGRIVIDPLDDSLIQPSSVDVRLDRFFRVFLNHTMAVIDVKENLEELTQLVEITDPENAFILHPGEFVLGATTERVALPDDMVARIEGKSSLGRLGLLIHSSLPGSEEVLIADESGLRPCRIEDVVRKRREGSVVGFDPETFETGYHQITGWYEGPPDRIFEIRLASGRSVQVTAGHNLFTLDRDGELTKVRTGALAKGARVAIARSVPDPAYAATVLDVAALVPESAHHTVCCDGPSISAAIDTDRRGIGQLLVEAGVTAWFCLRRGRLPMSVASQVPGLVSSLGPADRIIGKGGRNGIPAVIRVDTELAWLLGLYVAEGYRRSHQVIVSNTDQAILGRAVSVFDRLGVPVYRSSGALTAMSSVMSMLIEWIGAGGKAADKRVPPLVFSWPRSLTSSFLSGVIDGDGTREDGRTSIWTVSDRLARDLLLLYSRVGQRAGSCSRIRGRSRLWQVYTPANEHTLLTAEGALPQSCAARPTLDRVIDGGLLWDEVVEVRDTGRTEPIFDLEVRPGGRKIENFLAGRGGVFVSNTAGFIDPGFDGHITLELSNVANLPITLYPGMKIGQISFHRLTTPADVPYGSGMLGSKYQGQRGPTPSRYWENFKGEP